MRRKDIREFLKGMIIRPKGKWESLAWRWDKFITFSLLAIFWIVNSAAFIWLLGIALFLGWFVYVCAKGK